MLDELPLKNINLIVGKNASGKSRVLNILNNLARLISGQQQQVFASGNSTLHFVDDMKQEYIYHLHYEDQRVLAERVTRGGDILLERGKGGAGQILAEKEGRRIEFQTPDTQLAALARQDTIQHTFLMPLSEWANSVYHYQFGTFLGKNTIILEVAHGGAAVNFRDPEQVVGIFKHGEKSFGENFKNEVIHDMEKIGYALRDIGTRIPESIIVQAPVAVS